MKHLEPFFTTLVLISTVSLLYSQSVLKPGFIKLPEGNLNIRASGTILVVHKVNQFESDSLHKQNHVQMFANLTNPDAFLLASKEVFTAARANKLKDEKIRMTVNVDYTGKP